MVTLTLGGVSVEAETIEHARISLAEGWLNSLNKFGPGDEVISPELQDVRSLAISEVARQAEAQRQKYVTPGDGKAMVYLTKQYLELGEYNRAIAAGQEPNPMLTLMMRDRAELTGGTIHDVATEWTTTIQQWYVVAAAIERVSDATVAALRAAMAVQEIAQIMAELTWPTFS